MNDTPEKVIARDIVMLTDRLANDWFAEYDGEPSTRELYDRLRAWAKETLAE